MDENDEKLIITRHNSKLLIIDINKGLRIFLSLIDEEIEELANQELIRFQTNPNREASLENSRLPMFRVCRPFWLTFEILRGIFHLLWEPTKQEEMGCANNTRSIRFRNIHNWTDDDNNDDQSNRMRLRRISSRLTVNNRKNFTPNQIESALESLISMPKFKKIVPSTRKRKKLTRQSDSSKSVTTTTDHRNRNRHNGKVVKPKISKPNLKKKPNVSKSRNQSSRTCNMKHVLFKDESNDKKNNKKSK